MKRGLQGQENSIIKVRLFVIGVLRRDSPPGAAAAASAAAAAAAATAIAKAMRKEERSWGLCATDYLCVNFIERK